MRLRDGLAELLFPTRCACCERPGQLLCADCAAALPLIDPARACLRCGAPDGRGGCRECSGRRFRFSEARCAGSLDAGLARCVVMLKDGGETRLARVLGELVAAAAADQADWADAVVPVPASRRAVARRGFDHALLLAEETSRALGVPVARSLAWGSAVDQRGLGRDARRANVARAFRAMGEVPVRALLLDDVITTGATLDAAAGVLLGAGAREVRAVSVARKWTPLGECPRPGDRPQSATLSMLPPGSVVAGDKP